MKSSSHLETLKDIKTVLDASGYNYHNEIAPESASYPFLTYEIDNSYSDGDATEVVLLYLNGWDLFSRTGSTLELENMMASVLLLLYRRKHVISTNYGLWYTLDSRQVLRDPEDDIRRRRHQYQVRIFGKE